MPYIKREITKEVYDRAMDHNGVISDKDDINAVFSISELCGYGVYNDRVSQGEDGKYYVNFYRGDTCD